MSLLYERVVTVLAGHRDPRMSEAFSGNVVLFNEPVFRRG